MSKAIQKIRLKFLPGNQKKFIDEIYSKSKFSTDKLAKIAKVHPRSFRDWRREKLTMPLKAAVIFCKKFNIILPEDKEIIIARWKKAKEEAGKIGGIAHFKKCGSPATVEGRRKGGIKAIANLKRNGRIPSVKIYRLPEKFSADLAEYVGIMLGDGGITSGQSTITCNSIEDQNYIKFVCSLGKKLFGEEPKCFKKKDCNAITIYYNGSFLVRYFLQIGLKIGNKVKQQVDVPKWIKQVKKYRIACLKGLMDTDGGIFLHKYKVNGRTYTYRKICFSNRSFPLLRFVFETLKELKFTPKIVDKVENKKVWLYNETETKQYLSLVGTHNSRLLKLFKEGDSDGHENGLLNRHELKSVNGFDSHTLRIF